MNPMNAAPNGAEPLKAEATTVRCGVVTGGGSGLGRAVAFELARLGWRVAVLGRREEALAATVQLAADENGADAAAGEVVAVRADVTSGADVQAAFARVRELFGRVDFLFNNAGMSGSGGRIDVLEVADWRRVIDVNVTGSFLCATVAFASWLSKTRGAVAF